MENLELPLRDITEELKTLNKNMEKLNAEISNMDVGLHNGFTNVTTMLRSINQSILGK